VCVCVCVYLVGGENGHGAGVVRSLRQLDREQQKEFHIPIVMRDSGQPPVTGTNTLTIIIGDLNDNRHYAAHKHVVAYSLDGPSLAVPVLYIARRSLYFVGSGVAAVTVPVPASSRNVGHEASQWPGPLHESSTENF